MKKKPVGKKQSPPQFAKKGASNPQADAAAALAQGAAKAGGPSPIPFQSLVQSARPGLPTMPSALQQIMAQMQS